MPVANVGALLREGDQPKRDQSLPVAVPGAPEAAQATIPTPAAATTARAMRFLPTNPKTPVTLKSLLV
jgi:hypothetical protein